MHFVPIHETQMQSLIPVPEVERRAEYLQEIGSDHPLMPVIQQCLSNVPG